MQAALGATLLLLAACRSEEKPPPAPARVQPPARVPAPESSLAKLLGADDAGCGTVDVLLDLPYCGKAPRPDRDRPLGRGPNLRPFDLEAAAQHTMRFYAVDGEPPSQPSTTPVQLALAAPARAKTNEEIVLTFTLTNTSAAPIVFARSVDGSFEHFRAPIVETYARDTSTGQTYAWTFGSHYGRCGNVDPRTLHDYPTVAPGGVVKDPFGPKSYADHIELTRPGRYLVWTVYAACEGGPGRGEDEGVPRPAALFTGPLVSSVHELTVQAP